MQLLPCTRSHHKLLEDERHQLLDDNHFPPAHTNLVSAMPLHVVPNFAANSFQMQPASGCQPTKKSIIFCLHSKKHVAAMVADAITILKCDANANAGQHDTTEQHHSSRGNGTAAKCVGRGAERRCRKLNWPSQHQTSMQQITLAVTLSVDAGNCIRCSDKC